MNIAIANATGSTQCQSRVATVVGRGGRVVGVVVVRATGGGGGEPTAQVLNWVAPPKVRCIRAG